MEVGDEEKSDEMAKKQSQSWYVSEDGLSYHLSSHTCRWEMSRKVNKWSKSYLSAGRLVKMDFPTFSLFLPRR